MSWHDRLVKARFMGFEFLTESHETKLGHRLVIHEFLGADSPLLEDLGAKSADINLTAYFIGSDYDLMRNKLLVLLNNSVADWLYHPWLGRTRVRAKEWTVSESTDKGGYCTIAINFVPEGMVSIGATNDPVDIAMDKLVTLSDVVQEVFELSEMALDTVNSVASWVTDKLNTLQSILSLASLPLSVLQQATSLIKAVKNDAISLLTTPARYVATLRTLFDGLLSADGKLSDADRVRVVSYLTSLATRYPIQSQLLSLSTPAGAITVPPSSAARLLALNPSINIAKVNVLSALFLVSVAGQLALTNYRTIENRDAALLSVLTAIDGLLPALPDTVFQAAVSARIAIYDALMAQDLQSTRQKEVFIAMSSTVLAHRLELLTTVRPSTVRQAHSSGRTVKTELDDSVFIAINAVRHPLFINGVIYG